MGHWANTTYINHVDADEVAVALAALASAEGMACIDPPASRNRRAVEPMQYDNALHNDVWAAAVFPGARLDGSGGWTVIQTAPLELLAERAAGAERMRLASLARNLSASAFQLNVYDTTGVILVEASGTGDILISGVNTQGRPLAWLGERLSAARHEAKFRLHPFQQVIAHARSGDELAGALAAHFGGANARYCDNAVSVSTLIGNGTFPAPGGTVRYFRWQGPSRQRFGPCASWAEYHATINR